MGKAKKFGIVVLAFFFFIAIVGVDSFLTDVETRVNDLESFDDRDYVTRTSESSCPRGSYEVDDRCLSCNPGYYLATDLKCYPESEKTQQISNQQINDCGGYGTLYVTKPISIYTAAVVEVDGYTVGTSDMSISVAAGSHHVRAWGMTTSGNEQSMSWNIYVDDCKQSLIKWN